MVFINDATFSKDADEIDLLKPPDEWTGDSVEDTQIKGFVVQWPIALHKRAAFFPPFSFFFFRCDGSPSYRRFCSSRT